MYYSKIKLAAIALPLLAMTACTLDDPDDSASIGSNSRLSSLTTGGLQLVRYEYDSQGRLTEIVNSYDDERLTISYSPFQMEILSYDYSDDNGIRYVSDRLTYTNAKFNTAGFITQCDMTEESYFDATDEMPTTNSCTTYLSYTSKNQISRATYSDDPEYTIYEWDKNGDLVCIKDSDSDGSDDIKISYCGAQNIKGLWSYFFVANSLEFASAFFGVAPAYLPKSIVSDEETIQNSFKISSDGYIQKERVYYPDEGFGMTISYHYKDVDASTAAPAAKIADINKLPHHAAKSIFLRTKKMK